MVHHILSIDFDYIMFPCIKLYNDLCGGGGNSTITWANIEMQRGVEEKFLQYDANAYTSIVKLVQLAMKKEGTELIPVEEHDKLVDILKEDPEYENDSFNLVNIDFHHDIMYRFNDRNIIKNFDKYNCSDWVGYLMIKDKLSEYTWVKAPNSSLYDHNLDGNYNIKFNIESRRIFDNMNEFLNEHPFDKIFLCFSPQWVPHKYKHLYDLIIDLFKPSDIKEE